MRNRLFSRVIPIAALGLVVLFKFENCAPAARFADAASSSNGTVKIVDNWAPSPVQFVSPSQVVTTNPEVIKGLCVGTPDGSLVNWAVLSSSNPSQIISSGQVECQNGEFQVAVNSVSFQSCADQLEIRAASSEDSSQIATTLLEPDCPSVAQ